MRRYYDRNERAEALAAAKAAAGGGTKHALKGASSVESQAEAHGFIRALMVDNSDPTPELLCSLTKQVGRDLTARAITLLPAKLIPCVAG